MLFSVLVNLSNSLFRACLTLFPLIEKQVKQAWHASSSSLPCWALLARGRMQQGTWLNFWCSYLPWRGPCENAITLQLQASLDWAPSKNKILLEVCRIRSSVWKLCSLHYQTKHTAVPMAAASAWGKLPGISGCLLFFSCSLWLSALVLLFTIGNLGQTRVAGGLPSRFWPCVF